MTKEKLKYLLAFLITILVGWLVFSLSGYSPSVMQIRMRSSKTGMATVFFGTGHRYSFKVTKSEEFKTYTIPLPKSGITPLKFRPINKIALVTISEVQLISCLTDQIMSDRHLAQNLDLLQHIQRLPNKKYFSGKTLSKDALLQIEKAARVNRMPVAIRLGMAIFFMSLTFLLVGQKPGSPRANSKKIKYIILLFILVPVVLGFAYVFVYGVNVPYFDEWVLVPLFEKYHTGELNFSELYAQHNEHRIFFPRIILLIIGVLTGFDTVIEMYFTQVLAALVLLIVFLKLKNQFGISLARIPAWILPIPFLIFSWRQYENFLWGLMITFVLPIVAGVLSFYYLDRLNRPHEKNPGKTHWRDFTLGILYAVVSSFSMAMGLLVWVAGIFQLICLPGKNPKKNLYTGIWTSLGIVTWIVYFLGYEKPGNHPSLLYSLTHPLEALKAFLLYLGSSLAWDESLSYVFGIILLAAAIILAIMIVQKKLVRENSFWLTLELYSLLVGGSILAGRVGFGKTAMLWSRYTTYSIPIVVSLYVLSVSIIKKKNQDKWVKVLPASLLVLIITGSIFSYANGYKTGKEWHRLRKSQAVNVLTIETRSKEALEGIFPSIPVLRYLAQRMKMLNYSVYRERDEYFYQPAKEAGSSEAASPVNQ